MAFPLIGQHDAAEGRVAAEAYSKQIPYFALIEVGRWPFGSDAFHFCVEAIDQDAEAEALLEAVGKDVIGHLEAWFAGVPVHAGDVDQEVITCGFQSAADRAKVIAVDPEVQLTAIEAGVGDAGGLDGEQGGYGVVL